MTNDLATRARAALEGVTEGPWHRPDLYFSEVQQADAESVATCWHEGFDGKTVTLHCIHPCSIEESAANARFIAAARDLVPDMADRIEELEAALRPFAAIASSDGEGFTYDFSRVTASGCQRASAAMKGGAMTDMPARIYADRPTTFDGMDVWHEKPGKGRTEYVRADHVQAQIAAALELAADTAEDWAGPDATACKDIAEAIRALTPEDAADALEAMLRAAEHSAFERAMDEIRREAQED